MRVGKAFLFGASLAALSLSANAQCLSYTYAELQFFSTEEMKKLRKENNKTYKQLGEMSVETVEEARWGLAMRQKCREANEVLDQMLKNRQKK